MAKLVDIAHAAGVSVTTASRVLNRSKQAERISEDCAQRVRQVALELGYVGGYHRRAIRTGRTETLGVALEISAPGKLAGKAPPLAQPYFHALLNGVELATHDAGYNLQLVVPSMSRRAIVRGVQQLRERRLDGLVILHSNAMPENTVVLAESPDLPIAVVQPRVPTELPQVCFDHTHAMGLVVDHLAQLGHEYILWLGPRNVLAAGVDREASLLKAAWDAGLRGQSCNYDPIPQESAEDPIGAEMAVVMAALEERLRLPRQFTAIACHNDLAAVAACRSLMKLGLRIPQDISVCGFDNAPGVWTAPPLTTIDHQLTEMGRRTTEIVLQMIDGGAEARERYRGRTEIIAPALVVRESTGPAHKPAP